MDFFVMSFMERVEYLIVWSISAYTVFIVWGWWFELNFSPNCKPFENWD